MYEEFNRYGKTEMSNSIGIGKRNMIQSASESRKWVFDRDRKKESKALLNIDVFKVFLTVLRKSGY